MKHQNIVNSISPLAKNEHYLCQTQAREFDVGVILYQKVKLNNHGHIMVACVAAQGRGGVGVRGRERSSLPSPLPPCAATQAKIMVEF